MAEVRITFRCSSNAAKKRVMKFLKRFGGGTSSTSGFYRLVDIARQAEIETTQLEKKLKEKVLKEWFGEQK